MNLDETFFLDTSDGSHECQVITSIYSETRNKYYLIYEYVDQDTEDIFVSSYDPNDEEALLKDITDEKELEEIASFLEEYEGE